MALQDSIPISTLERAISTDVVTAEDLINRALSDSVDPAYLTGLQPALADEFENCEGVKLKLLGRLIYSKDGVFHCEYSTKL